jgi:hypothetical protein
MEMRRLLEEIGIRGRVDRHRLAINGGRVYCPRREREVVTDDCLRCGFLRALGADGLTCGFRAVPVPSRHRR